MGGLRGRVDHDFDGFSKFRKHLVNGAAIPDVHGEVAIMLELLLQRAARGKRGSLRPEKLPAHVVVDASYFQTCSMKTLARFGAYQTRRSAYNGNTHPDD